MPVKVVHDDAFGWGILLNGKPVKCLFTKREDAIDWLHTALAPHPDASAKLMLETAADLLEQLAHELVATNKRLMQLEARVEALES